MVRLPASRRWSRVGQDSLGSWPSLASALRIASRSSRDRRVPLTVTFGAVTSVSPKARLTLSRTRSWTAEAASCAMAGADGTGPVSSATAQAEASSARMRTGRRVDDVMAGSDRRLAGERGWTVRRLSLPVFHRRGNCGRATQRTLRPRCSSAPPRIVVPGHRLLPKAGNHRSGRCARLRRRCRSRRMPSPAGSRS